MQWYFAFSEEIQVSRFLSEAEECCLQSSEDYKGTFLMLSKISSKRSLAVSPSPPVADTQEIRSG